jgi:hypothetical protein
LDPATLKVQVFPLPRRFIYTRTTAEPVLGMYEYELLGEQGASA